MMNTIAAWRINSNKSKCRIYHFIVGGQIIRIEDFT